MSVEEFEIAVEIMKETDKAFLVFDGEQELWLPKSELSYMEPLAKVGKTTSVVLPMWLAEKKGLV